MDFQAPGFLTEVLVYALAALLGSIALIYFCAAVKRCSFEESRSALTAKLEGMLEIFPTEYKKLAKRALGAFGAFTLLMALAVCFGFVGKALAPPLAMSFSYFGNADARLWTEKKAEIMHAEDRLRMAHNLNAKKWKLFMDDMGRPHVRIVRTLIPFSLLLALAAITDALQRKHWKRGAALLAAALFFFLTTNYMWSNLQGEYVRNLRFEYGRALDAASFPALEKPMP